MTLNQTTKFQALKLKALLLGADEFGYSKHKNKRFYVVYYGKIINFGLKNGQTFIDHENTNKKDAWLKRHSKITNKHGQYVIRLKTSPSFWSHKILWN